MDAATITRADGSKGTAGRFGLDEGGARAWLGRVTAFWDGIAYDSGLEDSPQVSSRWRPAEPGEESTVWRLVREAADGGIITRPGDLDLDFEYADDEDGGMYYFLVRTGGLKLASHAEEMRRVGGRDLAGAGAALAVLREAVREGNAVLAGLDAYVAGRGRFRAECPAGAGGCGYASEPVTLGAALALAREHEADHRADRCE